MSLALFLAVCLAVCPGCGGAAGPAASPGVQVSPLRNPKWAEPIALPGAENFHRVSSDLYRSAQPSPEAFRAYEAFGIKTVINLRASYSDRAGLAGTGLKLIEVPLKTWAIDDEDVIAVLKLIKNEPKPILLHCRHGADRTGLMTAMYRLVFQGWSKEAALEELRDGGYGFHAVWINITGYLKKVEAEKIRLAVEAGPAI